MTKHANEEAGGVLTAKLCVLDEERRARSVVPASGAAALRLPIYDATVEVGLCTIVRDAAIEHTDEQGEVTIELPKLDELMASAAVARCLTPIKLRGWEIKGMRKIMRLTLAELADSLDERTAVETISRWESEAQPMGGYAEKVLRLFVCERLQKQAPGIEYSASMIANLKVRDPWRSDPNHKAPCIEFDLIHLKEESGTIIDAWNAKKAT